MYLEEMLATIGINVRNSNGCLKELSVILEEISYIWDSLTQSDKEDISEEILYGKLKENLDDDDEKEEDYEY